MKKNIIYIGLAVIIATGLFFGGMMFGKNSKGKNVLGIGNFQNLSQSQRQQFMQQNGARSGQNMMEGFVTGEIISKDDKSITVKLRDGGSKIILYSASTEIGKNTTGTTSDIEVGKSISVTGQTNQDGSVTAKSIQIGPIAKNPVTNPQQ